MKEWRSVVADCAAMLSTPVPYLLELDWSEVCLWHEEARRLSGAAAARQRR